MIRNSSKGNNGANSHQSSGSTGSNLFQNLKKLASSGSGSINKSDISGPKQQASSSAAAQARKTQDLRPLNKNSTLNTTNLSQYINSTQSNSSQSNNNLTRSPTSSTKYSYSKRSSNGTTFTNSNLSKISRQPTMSTSSVFSSGSNPNSHMAISNYLSRFASMDGNVILEMPNDPMEVEALFEDLMYKRNILQALSPEKQHDLMNYDVNKKWTIVKQDLQNELKKMKSGSVPTNSSFQNQPLNNNTNSMEISSENDFLHPAMTNSNFQNETSSFSDMDSIAPSSYSGFKGRRLPQSVVSSTATNNSISTPGGIDPIVSSRSSSSTDKTDRPPIHYVKKIIANKLTNEEINDLWVTLRTEQLTWVDNFLEHQGHIAMATVLMNNIYKVPANSHIQLTPELLDREVAFFKCFRVLAMLSQGIAEFLKHTSMTNTIAYGLLSTRLSTRKMALEIFLFMLQKTPNTGFEGNNSQDEKLEIILTCLDKFFNKDDNLHMVRLLGNSLNPTVNNENSRFKIIQAWIFVFEQTINGRGKMGSLVGASAEYKTVGGENAILEYSLLCMVFLNSICNTSTDLNQRVLLRTKVENLGLMRVITNLKRLSYDKITEQIVIYENYKLDDYNLVMESNQNKFANIDMQDPKTLINSLWQAFKGTENEPILLSLMQHLFLSSNKVLTDFQDPAKLSKQLKLVDSLLDNMSTSSFDEESLLNISIQRLYDSMQTDDVARRAIMESRTLTKKMDELQAERDYLKEKLSKAGNGLVGQLENELKERDGILAKSQRVTKQLEAELEDLKKKHLLEKHEREVELRKLLTLVNSQELDSLPQGEIQSLDPNKLRIQKALEVQLNMTKKDITADSKRFGLTVQPNKRLKMLRMKMEDIENEARELENTNFKDYQKKNNLKAPAVIVKKSESQKQELQKKQKEVKERKLAELRKALQAIQNETNDVTKFNVDSRVNELFQEKKLNALNRLKQLEQKYQGFQVGFDPDAIEENSSSEVHSSLDPHTVEEQFSELDRITNELSSMAATGDIESDASSTESNNIYMDKDGRSDHDPNKGVPNANALAEGSSFLESLSQKYGTGQNPSSPSMSASPTSRIASMGEKSFMNRFKKPNMNAPFLEELSQRVNVPQSPTSIDGEHDDKELEKTLSAEAEDPESDNDKSSSEFVDSNADITITNPSSPPPPPPLPSKIFEVGEEDSIKTAEAGSAPPPPPPPPPPGLFGNSPAAPPPPPLPAALSPAAADSTVTPKIPPPAPAFSSHKSMYRPSDSPLLPQSPSLFEKYPRPQKKLKQLHWDKLDVSDSSIWSATKAEKFADDLYEKGVLHGLEKAFAAREIKSLASKKKEDLDNISFLSRDISQQFGINLHMYGNLSVEELVKKILKCDRELIKLPSVIDFLSKQEIVEVSVNLARNYAPYSTDWEGVQTVEEAKPPEKDPSELQRADQIYLQLMVNLQSYWSSRMRALKVITSYEREYTELVTKLRKVDKAVSAIQKSENLSNTFNVILAVGNYMNDSSKQAQGFKLSTLQRLTFIKDATNSMTFLNYVEKIVRQNYSEFNNFINDLEPVMDVVKTSVEQLIIECEEFSQSIANVEKSLEIGNLSDSNKFHPMDKILAKVVPVIPEASRKSQLLKDEVKLSLMEFNALLQKYGEDPSNKFAKDSFFKKFADFINEYKRAQTQNLKVEEEERVYERHKKMVEEQQRKAREVNEAEGEDMGEETGDRRAVMDKLLEQLKNAGPTKSDPSSARKRATMKKRLMNDKDMANDLVANVNNGNDSIVYSPDDKHTDADIHAESPLPKGRISGIMLPEVMEHSNEESSEKDLDSTPAKKEPSSEVLGDRAKQLLFELRGSETPSKRISQLDDTREKLLTRRSRRRTDTDSNKLTFVDAEEKLESTDDTMEYGQQEPVAVSDDITT